MNNLEQWNHSGLSCHVQGCGDVRCPREGLTVPACVFAEPGGGCEGAVDGKGEVGSEKHQLTQREPSEYPTLRPST